MRLFFLPAILPQLSPYSPPFPSPLFSHNSRQILYSFVFHTTLCHRAHSHPEIKLSPSFASSVCPRDRAEWRIKPPLNARHARRTSVCLCNGYPMKLIVRYVSLSPILYFFPLPTLNSKLDRGGISAESWRRSSSTQQDSFLIWSAAVGP